MITVEDGRGRRLADATGTPSQVFIPGALLPLVLGKLPYRPMMLQVEGMLDPAGWVCPDPITLLLEPAFDVARYTAGSAEAMRCWKVEVSGTGRSSRWYLSPDGRLQAISFGGGVHLHRLESDPATRPSTTLPSTKPSHQE
jgi:hypothetical protein